MGQERKVQMKIQRDNCLLREQAKVKPAIQEVENEKKEVQKQHPKEESPNSKFQKPKIQTPKSQKFQIRKKTNLSSTSTNASQLKVKVDIERKEKKESQKMFQNDQKEANRTHVIPGSLEE